VAREGADTGAPSTFGARLRHARTRAGLSQTALAGADLSPSYVSHLESGRREPTAAVVAVLAQRLGIPVTDLEPPAPPAPTHDLVLAEAALGIGNPSEAVALLEPWHDQLTRVESLAADPVLFRAGEVRAAALERDGRTSDAARQLERLLLAAESAPALLPWVPVTVSLLRIYREAGDLGRAVDLGERALRRGADLRIDGVPGFAPLVVTVAGVYDERGDLMRAQGILDDLIERLEAEGTDDDRAKALWNAAINATERGHAGEGMRLADEANARAESGSDLLVRARLRYSRAWILLHQDPPRAEEARRELRALLPEVRQHAGAMLVGPVLSELARAELFLGRPEVARRHAKASLDKLDESRVMERAHSLVLLGAASVAVGDAAIGVSLLEEAATALGAVEASRYSALAWRQLAEVYRALGDDSRALEAMTQALAAAGLATAPVLPVAPPAAQRSAARRATARV
jgi:transcriptional regulator with XRE-family HTH domain